MTAAATSEAPNELHSPAYRHRDIRSGGARAAVFGVSDGLVSNASLVFGMEGAHPAATAVRLAGIAGLLGGALSMAAGELVSMRAQAELLKRELDIESTEIASHPEGEQEELMMIYERRGVTPELARVLAAEMMATPERALDTHAREELGIDPDELGSPVAAALASFGSFALGALVPLSAVLLASGGAAVALAVALSTLAAAVVGAALGIFSGRSWWWSAARQVGVCAAAAAITFGLGTAVGHVHGL